MKEGWPVLRLTLLIISICWVTAFVGFMWVYRPLKAASLYKQGIEKIAQDDISDAKKLFLDAWYGWPLFSSDKKESERISHSPVVVKGWQEKNRWLDYARAFRARKHWGSAEEFYAGYIDVNPYKKKERIEYARFLSKVLGHYDKALKVLDTAPLSKSSMEERDFLLEKGDVYLSWAEDDPSMYENARYYYAKVLETSRNDERAMLSMMRYHLRLDNDKEIETLLPAFSKENPGKTKEPELAAEVYADLGQWFLSHGKPERARNFINLALAACPAIAEPHFINAVYYRTMEEHPKEEMKSYLRALMVLDSMESVDRKNLRIRILSEGGIGRLYYRKFQSIKNNSPEAVSTLDLSKEYYGKAIKLYEDARKRKLLGASPEYGNLYLEMGNILYNGINPADLVFTLADTPESFAEGSARRSELERAEEYYGIAEDIFGRKKDESRLPDTALYRRAYARYVLKRDGALVDFYRVTRNRPYNYDANLALAAVLLDSGDYEASQNSYVRVLELLDEELLKTGGVLNPWDKPGHKELLLRYIIAWNNLGAGRALSAARGGMNNDYGDALSAFTMASEYQDMVSSYMKDLSSRGAAVLRDDDDVRIREYASDSGRNNLKEKITFPYINRLRVLDLADSPNDGGKYLVYKDIPANIQINEKH